MNYAYGSMLGAAVGDAAGAPLEFYSGCITKDIAENMLYMPGGGCFQVGNGQITDDSELMLLLGAALTAFETDPEEGMPLNLIKAYYKQWIYTNPFDCGNTCRNAFLMDRLDMDSKSNGALMRATPIAVFAHKQTVKEIAQYAIDDANLSHPNPVCLDANAAYCVAIAHLINNPGDSEGAIKSAKSVVNGEVFSWLDKVTDLKFTEYPYQCTRQIGYVKWGLTLAFYHLKRKTSYTDAITEVLLQGGDTDTNAAICGGLIGALHGASSIPDYMKNPVENYTYEIHGGHKRPKILSASNIYSIVKKLY